MERRGNEFHVFVSMVEIFADDVIRKQYVEPALDELNAGIDRIIFKAKGQAINVAVRAALLLEAVMGVMQKRVSISSEPARPSRDRPDKDGGPRHDRLISAMEISMRRF
jgi:DNA-binding protein